jgi:hypothetical protein
VGSRGLGVEDDERTVEGKAILEHSAKCYQRGFEPAVAMACLLLLPLSW